LHSGVLQVLQVIHGQHFRWRESRAEGASAFIFAVHTTGRQGELHEGLKRNICGAFTPYSFWLATKHGNAFKAAARHIIKVKMAQN
jgi:hypothetical protein